MELRRLPFVEHRILWSRVVAIFAIAYVALVPPPRLFGHTLLDVGEIIGFFLLVIAALGRLWCLSFIAGMKNEILVTEGPYSVVRNPLYVFNFLGAIGLGLAVENPPLALLLACGFAVFYPSVVRNEEARLEQGFGNTFAAYCAATPRWIPDWSKFHEPDSWVISPYRFRKGLLDAMWFLWVYIIWEVIEETPLIDVLHRNL